MSAALEALGFGPNERAIILHADDIGMCQASVSAWIEMLDFGMVSSASVMVPCPWFPKVAAFCRQHPSVDMGVHLTLTSEWRACRWAPISTVDPASGLLDVDGYFFREPQQFLGQLSIPAAVGELRAQVDRALHAGIDVTHVDSHMFSAIYPVLLPSYLDLSLKYQLPCLAWKPTTPVFHFTQKDIVEIGTIVSGYEDRDLIPVDHAFAIHYENPENAVAEIKRGIDSLPSGLTHFLIHPAKDTPELREMCAHWRHRVADYEVFRNPAILRHMEEAGVHLVGYRALRDALPNRQPAYES